MFSAENSSYNSYMPSLTVEQNQAAVNYMSNNSSYLPSLMQTLTLSNNNYQGDIALPDQNNVQTSTPNYVTNLFPTRERCVQPVIATQAPALYHQYPTAPNISNNYGCNGYNYQALSTQSPAFYPITQDHYCGSFINSRPYDRTQVFLDCMIVNPYLVMMNSQSSRDFVSLLDVCKKKKNKKVLNLLVEKMAEFPAETLIQVSCHKYGCRVIKKLISVAKRVPSISLLPLVYASRIVVMTNSKFGWPVVQSCLRSLDKVKNGPLYEELVNHFLEIATSKYGCIAIQKYLDFMDAIPSQPYYSSQDSIESYSPKKRLFKAISNHAPLLAQDPYGNFVLQFVIWRYPEECLEAIAVALEPLYETLCTIENGSYLVEKILKTPCRSHVTQVLLESSHLGMLAQDEYGNFAIQTLLKETKEHAADDYHKFCKKMSLDIGTLENSIFGKNVSRLLQNWCKDEANKGVMMHKRPKEMNRQRNAIFVEKKAQQKGDRCSSCGATKEIL